MVNLKSLVGLGLVVVVLLGVVGPVTAHETQDVEGYDVTFGAADEPAITGERMWMRFEIVDGETGEPVEGQADSLIISVQKKDGEKVPLEVSESHGEPGVYEAAVIFTEPGEYMLHIEGRIEGTGVHTHFKKEVHDHAELEYPGDDSQADNQFVTDSFQSGLRGYGSSVGVAVAAVVAVLGAGLVYRRR